MAGEPNQVKWRGIRPVNPPENIPCKVNYTPPAADCEPNQVKWIGIRPTNPAVTIPISLPDGCPKLKDADGDTKVDVEESADEDIVRMDVAGVEVFKLNADGILDLPKQSRTRAYLGTFQTVPPSTFTKVELDTESYDNQNEFDPTTNHRFTATKAGCYQVNGAIHFVTNIGEGKRLLVAIYVNGTEVSRCDVESVSLTYISAAVSDCINLSVNDYVELYVYHDKGSDATLLNFASRTFLSIHKLS